MPPQKRKRISVRRLKRRPKAAPPSPQASQFPSLPLPLSSEFVLTAFSFFPFLFPFGRHAEQCLTHIRRSINICFLNVSSFHSGKLKFLPFWITLHFFLVPTFHICPFNIFCFQNDSPKKLVLVQIPFRTSQVLLVATILRQNSTR